ncbi:MAG: guanylate kinase [Acidimicrobiia bacterium]
MSAKDKPSSTSSAEPSSNGSPGSGRLFVISGPSGVGKGSVIIKLACRSNFHLSVSATTREPRPGEVDGVDYYFLGEDQFREWLDEGRFLEWAEFSTHLYGTPRAAVEEQLGRGIDVVLEIEVKGAMQVKQAMPDAVLIFITPPSIEELEARLAGRGDTADIARRLARAKAELELADQFDSRINNDVLAETVGEVLLLLAPEVPLND